MLYRILMTLLRFILVFVLAYYLLKVLYRWLVGMASRGAAVKGGNGARSSDRSYRELTDQEIEDAEYEDLEGGKG
jgi:hypothetical protein